MLSEAASKVRFHLVQHMRTVWMLASPPNPTKMGVRHPERESCSTCFRIRTPMGLHESPAAHLEPGSRLGPGVVEQHLGLLACSDFLVLVRCRGQWIEYGRHYSHPQNSVVAFQVDPSREEEVDCLPTASYPHSVAHLHVQIREVCSASAACTSDHPEETHRCRSLDVS